MADAVGGLLADPALAARLSLAGRALAETCAWTAVRPQWEALFASVLEGHDATGARAPTHVRGVTG